MTHAIYTYQQLQLKSIARLKQIYSEIACTVEVNDKRCKDAWITAIAQHQAQHIHRIAPTALDQQAISQAELENFIADQAEAVVSKELELLNVFFAITLFNFNNGK